LTIDLIEQQDSNLLIKFYCEQEREIQLCQLPKITRQGSFIINGHDKAVIFQSVRAPSIYLFANEKDNKKEGPYAEIIPIKGP
jgi:DNA-directed RNA polymerase beta subunit